MTKKKILISILSTIIFIVASYSIAWNVVKHNAEKTISEKITHVTQQPSIKSVSYKLNTSCFPKMCIELKDLEVVTTKYFAKSKEGFKFNLFNEEPIVYTTNNIFSNKINYSKKQARFDVSSTILDNNQVIKFYVDFNNIIISADKNSLNADIQGALVQATSLQAPLKALLDIDQLTVSLNKEVNKDTQDMSFAYEAFNAKVFSKTENKVIYEIPHTKNTLVISNLDKDFLNKTSRRNKTNKQYVEESVNNFKKYQTTISLPEIKFTDSNSQVLGKAEIFIDSDYFLNANADFAFRFEEENTKLENILKAYKIKQNNKKSYIINVRTNKNIISINKGISIPAPFFKPTETK